MGQEFKYYGFRDKSLLDTALTHSSYANEHKQEKISSNERLEFLGDAILDAVISEKIFKDYAELPEGDMTRIRAGLVCEPSLSKKARELGLDGMLMMSRGERQTGGAGKDSVLCDVFEAVIGAIFLDGGYEAAKNYILPMFLEDIKDVRESFYLSDPKSFLQEELQKTSTDVIEYRTVAEDGPDHEKIFTVEARYRGEKIGGGVGKNKKEAAQAAALDAIKRLGFLK